MQIIVLLAVVALALWFFWKVFITFPGEMLVMLAGGHGPNDLIGSIFYACWPIVMAGYALAAFLQEDYLDGTRWNRVPDNFMSLGTLTIGWLVFYLLPIIVNIFCVILRSFGINEAADSLFAWRWSSQPAALGCIIVLGLAYYIILQLAKREVIKARNSLR